MKYQLWVPDTSNVSEKDKQKGVEVFNKAMVSLEKVHKENILIIRRILGVS